MSDREREINGGKLVIGSRIITKLVVECSVLDGRHDGNSSVFQELVGEA